MGCARAPRIGLLAAAFGAACALGAACASGSASGPGAKAAGAGEEDYLRWMAFEVRLNETVLLRWHERDMPLRVFLPRPPEGLFEQPEAIYDSVRDGVLDWTDVAAPGIPSFVFVEDIGEADIPIVWSHGRDGYWYVAHCLYAANLAQRFGVTQILVTGRWSESRTADLHEVYAAMLHEMGHALGLGGHSPDPEDVMFPSVARRTREGLGPRDRATLARLYARPVGAHVVGARRLR